jgi:uncharacterized protein YgiM (DUF1202 family)
MVAAHQTHRVTCLIFLALAAALAAPPITRAAVGSPQTCAPSSTCVVGEFLYDDDYSPITDATCSATSKYPDGTAHLTDQSMSASSDGWYSYEFTAPTTTGYYRAQVCCTTDSDYLCVDKSFEVKSSTGATASEVATAVWGYSSRTLTSFGSLTTDIWAVSSRSLTSFGNLVTDVWGNATRTLTGTSLTSGNLATQTDVSDLSDLEAAVAENRTLLEQLVNAPIIESSMEEVEDTDLRGEISQAKTLVSQLEINQQFLTSKTDSTVSKWGELSERELLDIFIEMDEVLGEETDSESTNSVLGNIVCLKKTWGWSQTDDLFDQMKSVKRTVAYLKERLSSSGKSKALQNEAKSLLVYLQTSGKILGDSTDKASAKTVFGRLKETEQLASAFEERLGETDEYLAEVNQKEPSSLKGKIEDLIKRVLAVNRLPRIGSLLKISANKELSLENKLKNQLLSTRALLLTNKRFLANGEKKILSTTWLEVGSIVIKTLVTNPSSLISQEVPLKYYLPKEIQREEDILEVDDGLTVKFDTEENQYYVEGEFTLKAGETRTFSVRVQDVWTTSEEEIESLRNQAAELFRPLEKTSYFAQGVTLKSDIDVSLDRVKVLLAEAITPEQKIKAYREAQIELEAVNTKMEKLKELVTTASGAGSLLGFVGGSQAIAVWGIIIVVAAGFIFLSLAMRKISRGEKETEETEETKGTKGTKGTKEKKNSFWQEKINRFRPAWPLISLGAVSALTTSLLVGSGLLVLDRVQSRENSSTPVVVEEEETGLAIGGVEMVKLISSEEEIILYSQPSSESTIERRLQSGQEAIKVSEEGNWIQILVVEDTSPESVLEGWVEKDFVETPEEEEEAGPSFEVVIQETPTGWLRVRQTPSGEEIGRVYPGEKYRFLSQESGWYQIEFEGEEAWVSGTYAEISETND